MTDALPGELSEVPTGSDRLVQQIFVVSPFGTLVTAVIIFAILAGGYAVVAVVAQIPILDSGARGMIVSSEPRAAFVLSLIVATVLGIQRYVTIRERADAPSYSLLTRRTAGARGAARQVAVVAPRGAAVTTATVIGMTVGLLASLFVMPNAPFAHGGRITPGFWWFMPMTMIVATLFFRGVAMSRAGAASARKFIDHELEIDLLRIDRLAVVGRSASRVALIWFSVSAVTCLFFVGGSLPLSAILLLLGGCAGMGIWIFVGTMERVHHRIRDVKAKELEHIRAQITTARNAVSSSGEAALKLQGLLAYEARIAAVHEWPFDQTTLMRVGASALILTVPWFGQALAGTLVERIGHLLH